MTTDHAKRPRRPHLLRAGSVRHPLTGDFLVGLVTVVALMVLAACSSGSQYSAKTGSVAERFIPAGQNVDHHPDSLGILTLKENSEKIEFSIEEGNYETLMRSWSTRPRDVSASPPFDGVFDLTYATLWSRELSLASLQPEAAVTSLSKEQARKVIERREQEYKDFLQIDVYWFGSPSENLVAGPATIVRLRTVRKGASADSTYNPTRRDYGPVREAFVSGGRTALYRRNTFYFNRQRNGSDLLDGTHRVILEVRPSGATRNLRFRWSWKSGDQKTTAHRN